MAERSKAGGIAAIFSGIPEVLKTIPARFFSFWARCRAPADQDVTETTEVTPVAVEEDIVLQEGEPFVSSQESGRMEHYPRPGDNPNPLTHDQKVVLALLQCGYCKYLYLPKERVTSSHGWLG